jgi:hypothetical protein
VHYAPHKRGVCVALHHAARHRALLEREAHGAAVATEARTPEREARLLDRFAPSESMPLASPGEEGRSPGPELSGQSAAELPTPDERGGLSTRSRGGGADAISYHGRPGRSPC